MVLGVPKFKDFRVFAIVFERICHVIHFFAKIWRHIWERSSASSVNMQLLQSKMELWILSVRTVEMFESYARKGFFMNPLWLH